MDSLVLEMPPAVCMFLRWSPQTTSHGGRRGTTVPQEAAPLGPQADAGQRRGLRRGAGVVPAVAAIHERHDLEIIGPASGAPERDASEAIRALSRTSWVSREPRPLQRPPRPT